MEGVDINLDVNIGKHLTSLGHTLTQMQTGTEEDDEEPVTLESPDSDSYSGKVSQDGGLVKQKKILDSLPSFLFDTSLDMKKRSLLMENEINEQTKVISDLRSLGASINTILHEERKLEELYALCYKYFRRDMIQVFKKIAFHFPFFSNNFLNLNLETQTSIRPQAFNNVISKSIKILCCTLANSRAH